MSRVLQADKLKPSPLSRRLVRRLRLEGLRLSLADDRYALQGLSPGRNQKSAGAWAWNLYDYRDGHGWRPANIGSSDPASSLRTGSRITWYEVRGGDIEVSIEQPRPLNHGGQSVVRTETSKPSAGKRSSR